MINLDDIPGTSTIDRLQTYKGKNPYILTLKRDSKKNGFKLTPNQITYIEDNFDKEPIKMDRIIKISSFLGEELQKKEELSFQPEKILVEYLLADTDKTFHIWGKVKRNQVESKMYWLPKTQVLDDLYFEEVEVDVDFEKYQKIDKLGRMPYEHQKSGVKFLLGRDGAILADDMGLGKSIADDVPVLTPNGWVLHGSLKIGDYVIGSNGKPTKVIGVFPNPMKKYYNITFSDGTVVESCDEHLWAVQTTNHRKRKSGFTIKPLKDLIGDLTWGTKGNLKWYIPMVKAVEFESREIKLNPYLLGCLLGDGSITQSNLRFTNIDKEIIDEVSKSLPDNMLLSDYTCEKEFGFRMIDKTIGNTLKEYLIEYGLYNTTSGTKFIPEDYLFNDINTRLELLRGLLDTDGYVAKDGTIQYYSISRKLTNGVKEIVQSLGGVARETTKIGPYKKEDGTIKQCELCYVLTINLPSEIIPFKLTRKRKRLKEFKKYQPSRGIKSVEFSRETPGQCIMVEAEDHLYVMDKYIVTHNTYQSIIAALESGAEKILIVCPSSVKINWEREINAFCDKTTIINGKKWDSSKFTIINYDILKNFHTVVDKRKKQTDEEIVLMNTKRHLALEKFDLVIIDEAHKLKDPKTIRGKIMNDLCDKHGIKKVWLLTGTPIANRPMDYYNLLKLIKAPIADNWVFFAKRYCEGKKFFKTLKNGRKKQIWLTNGASNLNELHLKTKNNILRRLKEDVLDMPDKTIVTNFHRLTQKQWDNYDELWDDFIEKRREEGKSVNLQRNLVELILLRKFIAMTAIDKTIELAEDAIEQGHKVIIFTTFTDELEEISDHFGTSSVIHYGGMSQTAKQKSVDDFQNKDKIKVFVGNVISAGVGITLTAGDVVIFNSFSWVPGDFEQATDRAYRIGQKNNVTVYVQLFKDTISTLMWGVLQKKQDIIETIMNGERYEDINDDILDLIEIE